MQTHGERHYANRIGWLRAAVLGAGGMGEVWAAEQERPIQRKVALKVIKLGMDSKAVLARFEARRRCWQIEVQDVSELVSTLEVDQKQAEKHDMPDLARCHCLTSDLQGSG